MSGIDVMKTYSFSLVTALLATLLAAGCADVATPTGSDTDTEAKPVIEQAHQVQTFAVSTWVEADWRDVELAEYPQSRHPYRNYTNDSYELRASECAEGVRVRFPEISLEYGYDFLVLLDGNGNEVQRLTGNYTNFVSDVIPGNIVEIRFTSDYSIRRWGFEVSGLQEVGDACTISPCARVRCMSGTHCELQDVVCITAPCEPVAVCIPDEVPDPCATTLCPPDTVCELQPVWCLVAPCPEQATCVAVEPACQPEDCGPALGMPNYECDDGSVGGPTGRCIEQDGGVCGWEVLDCPDPCDELACSDDQRCVLEEVWCITTPCPPLARCADNNYCADASECPRDGEAFTPACVGTWACTDHQCEFQCDTTPLWESFALDFGSDNPYANNQVLGWRIRGPESATQMRVVFDHFDLETDYDFVEIYDSASNLVASYTGPLGPFTTAAVPGNIVQVVLRTDYSVTRSGFRVSAVEAQ